MQPAQAIEIRDLIDIPSLTEAQALEKEVWSSSDRDLVPVVLLIAEREVGATLLGAYDGGTLVGICYGFPGRENGEAVIHSHVLGVKKAYRDRNIGYLLKAAQRQRALANDFRHITWTFDPLQSRNAFFNLEKLGAMAMHYKLDFYGSGMDSPLHAGGTDRLWMVWDVGSPRVEQRLLVGAQRTERPAVEALLSSDGGVPARNSSSGVLHQPQTRIEVPSTIDAIRESDPDLLVRWRQAVRWAFTSAFDAGMRVTGFQGGSYILGRYS